MRYAFEAIMHRRISKRFIVSEGQPEQADRHGVFK